MNSNDLIGNEYSSMSHCSLSTKRNCFFFGMLQKQWIVLYVQNDGQQARFPSCMDVAMLAMTFFAMLFFAVVIIKHST